MIIKLKKKNVAFRNPQLFNSEIKTLSLDRLLSNLYQLIASEGTDITLGKIKNGHSIDSLKEYMKKLEEKGMITGVSDNMEAVEDWLRSNLVNMVYRGNVVKENVTSLMPMHLMSYRIQNKKYNRDYSTSNQVYLMLRQHPEVLSGLKDYLGKGWDGTTNAIVESADLDVDTACILMLIQGITEKKKPNTEINTDKPLLKKQTALFCDDIRRLLVYSDVLPRTVFIEYLRILIGFHLALYLMKMIYLLPRMCDAGTTEVADDWSMVIDLTDDLDSEVAPIACRDIERMVNTLQRYFRSTFEINTIQATHKTFGEECTVADAIKELSTLDKSDTWYKMEIKNILDTISEEEDLKAVNDKLKYFDQDNYFDRFIHLLEMTSGGSAYQFKYHKDFLDSVTMKNSDSMLLADGRRSRRHPRRGAMGSKLLETLVQILVLEKKENGKYSSRSFSIDELAQLIKDRYGLIINGLNEDRFKNADVETHAAFKENMEAFKNKLRQIGFYTDLSDACLLQKIRPRYNI